MSASLIKPNIKSNTHCYSGANLLQRFVNSGSALTTRLQLSLNFASFITYHLWPDLGKTYLLATSKLLTKVSWKSNNLVFWNIWVKQLLNFLAVKFHTKSCFLLGDMDDYIRLTNYPKGRFSKIWSHLSVVLKPQINCLLLNADLSCHSNDDIDKCLNFVTFSSEQVSPSLVLLFADDFLLYRVVQTEADAWKTSLLSLMQSSIAPRKKLLVWNFIARRFNSCFIQMWQKLN